MKTIAVLGSLCLISWGLLSGNRDDGQQQEAKENTLTEVDKLRIAVQGICPVSGQKLGSMGEPIKIKAGEQIAFLCCEGCKTKQIDADHWKTIQTRIATAQSTCPIMEEEVDSSMKSTVIDGQPIFVCCPPCIPKIEENPEASIEKVYASYRAFVASEQQAESDKLHATAQGICPVSGKRLGSMGAPIKVRVGDDETAFLCCQGCTGEPINADFWKEIQTNLAKAQGVCPVMQEPVDASMSSTVVNGRKIFVCCPPCIEKIEAEPALYVGKLNAQIANGGVGESGPTDGERPSKEDR